MTDTTRNEKPRDNVVAALVDFGFDAKGAIRLKARIAKLFPAAPEEAVLAAIRRLPPTMEKDPFEIADALSALIVSPAETKEAKPASDVKSPSAEAAPSSFAPDDADVEWGELFAVLRLQQPGILRSLCSATDST